MRLKERLTSGERTIGKSCTDAAVVLPHVIR